MFVDEAHILVRSGSGGNGCASFRREKYVPRGGPDGGDGGNGGSVRLVAATQHTTLGHVSRRSLYAAENGRPGSGNNRHGRNGEDIIIEVPVGTIVREYDPESVATERGTPSREELNEAARGALIVADLSSDGTEFVVARGGRGGRGNKYFTTATNQAPKHAEDGAPGVEKRLYLELKLLADAGLVGLPNAGKSTLLRSISKATPKVADYPFTTLHPHLGIAEIGSRRAGDRLDARRIVFADIPGLIEGAHEGHGLGVEFLRHIERTRVLVHLVSIENPDVEALREQCRVIEEELEGFDESLAAKPRIIALSKCDLIPKEDAAAIVDSFARALDRPVLGISAATGSGVEELLWAVERLVSGETPN